MNNLQHWVRQKTRSTIEQKKMEGKKLNDKKISSFDFSLQSFNSFCDCTPFYFTEFPQFQKMKNKELPELRIFPLDNNVSPGTNAQWKCCRIAFFNSLVQMWEIVTANRWKRSVSIDVNRRLNSSAIRIMMMGLKIRFHFTEKLSVESEEPSLRTRHNYNLYSTMHWGNVAHMEAKSVLSNFLGYSFLSASFYTFFCR